MEQDQSWRARWARTKARLQALFKEYGPVALGVWFTIFGLVLGGFYTALSMGFDVSMTAQPEAGVGTFAAAYGATQLTKPLRAVATLALTPLVARLLGRHPQPVEPDDAPSG
ncbi:MAG: DUF1279 domain-containing protein [Alphaproteobacteria bacterium]|nr:DUF1279 domain-containing protein [Alphaproteobacteria bacterium]